MGIIISVLLFFFLIIIGCAGNNSETPQLNIRSQEEPEASLEFYRFYDLFESALNEWWNKEGRLVAKGQWKIYVSEVPGSHPPFTDFNVQIRGFILMDKKLKKASLEFTIFRKDKFQWIDFVATANLAATQTRKFIMGELSLEKFQKAALETKSAFLFLIKHFLE